MLQLVKSLPFHIPELSKRYPFLAEPSRVVHYMDYPPPSPAGCIPSSANDIKSLDNSTATAVIFLNKVSRVRETTTPGHFSHRLAIKAKAPSHRD